MTQVALRRSKNLPQPRTFAFLAAAGLAAALVGGAVSNLALASEGALVIALAAVSYAWDVHTRPRARAILTQTQAREGQTPDAAPTAQPVQGRLLQSPGPAWAWGLVLLMATGVGTLATWHPQQATAAQTNNELRTLAASEEAHHRATGTYTTNLTVPSRFGDTTIIAGQNSYCIQLGNYRYNSATDRTALKGTCPLFGLP